MIASAAGVLGNRGALCRRPPRPCVREYAGTVVEDLVVEVYAECPARR